MTDKWVRIRGRKRRWHIFRQRVDDTVYTLCPMTFLESEALEWTDKPWYSEKCWHCWARAKKEREREKDATA